jgi:hypothetical protein
MYGAVRRFLFCRPLALGLQQAILGIWEQTVAQRPRPLNTTPALAVSRSDNMLFIVCTSGIDPFARAHALGAETHLVPWHRLPCLGSSHPSRQMLTVQREENGPSCPCFLPSLHFRNSPITTLPHTRYMMGYPTRPCSTCSGGASTPRGTPPPPVTCTGGHNPSTASARMTSPWAS